MFQETVPILWNHYLGSAYYRIGIACSAQYEHALPGQFIMLRFGQDYTPFLSRPFSVHRLIVQNGAFQGIEVLYKVVGDFTGKLSLRRKGDSITALGPLGNHFTISNCGCVFLVGGGVGIAPMPFLASELLKNGVGLHRITAFIGGRNEADILCREDFDSCSMPIQVATEDGSAGEKGMVTELLAGHIGVTPPDIIYACGPEPMLKKVAMISRQHHIPCQVSLETVMACGIGACMGCTVKTAPIPDKKHPDFSPRYSRACVDGPVFDGAAAF